MDHESHCAEAHRLQMEVLDEDLLAACNGLPWQRCTEVNHLVFIQLIRELRKISSRLGSDVRIGL
jgi:hypothetical protein